MPTASAKLEKFASVEACDPIRQIVMLVEKKVRNLEKRKGKLDNYRNDDKNGKELNEDQKNAMKKYDQVIEVLEFAKELQKSFIAIFQESAKLQKKFQKKELAERQHHELQQIRQLLLFQDMLAKLQSENAQNDFLNGENGAVKLSKEDIEWLGEFHKIISPDESNDEISGNVENNFSSIAEHFLALLEAKNRDILGTTYKHLKELLISVHDSGYFSLRSINSENGSISVEEPELHMQEMESKEDFQEDTYNENGDISADINGNSDTSEDHSVNFAEEVPVEPTEEHKETSNHQLHDVLVTEGTFDFLQESQIDMESPHMDPAVVVAHPMAPPPNVTCHAQSPTSASTSTDVAENETGHIPATIIVPFQPVAVPPPTADTTMTLSQAVLNHPPQDYDPDQPIPTQTFTNQNFVALQSTMTVMSPAYVPATVSAQHDTPVTVIKKQPSDIAPLVVHNREISSSICGSKNLEREDKETKNYVDSSNIGVEEPINNGENKMSRLEEMPENQNLTSASGHYPHVQNHQSRNFNHRGMRGGRGRGSSNGYIRGRGSYGNGRGYYQNSYGGRDSSGSSTGYSGYRRGPRSGPRGGGSRGGSRGGRGNYRPQQQQ